MFQKHRAKKAAHTYQEALAKWQAQRDGYAELLEIATTFNGVKSDQIMLGSGEAVFYKVASASLIEERSTRGHYEGRSSGVSIPVGSIGGRTVRYHVGASRGHFVQGAPVPTAIDTGTAYITNKRVIFVGARQTRECTFAKLIGFQHSDTEGRTTFSVSNRQKPTVIAYGPNLVGAFDFRLDLALAHYRGNVGDLVARINKDLAQIDSQRPAVPAESLA